VVVTRPAKPREPLLHFGTLKIPFVSFVRVARLRDQVVPRKETHVPPAQFANAAHARRRLTNQPGFQIPKRRQKSKTATARLHDHG
jgi:hypothetical protein